MKQKKIGKKLNLNKKTIAALDNRQINAAHGGTGPVIIVGGMTCGTCAQTCTCRQPCPICATGLLTSCPSDMMPVSQCVVC